jgi:hypothetical protein
MTIAIVSTISWLLILVTAMSLAKAAKRSDELAEAAQCDRLGSQDAQIIPFRQRRRRPDDTECTLA